jgi:large subunit ribosomal protein L33
MARKTDRITITLECSEARKEGKTPSRYTTQKNKKTTTEKLSLRKYNPYLGKVTVHKEVKA